jgi:hypothetical protein
MNRWLSLVSLSVVAATGCATSDAGSSPDATMMVPVDAAGNLDAPVSPADAASSIDAGPADADTTDAPVAMIDAAPDTPDADPPDAMPPDAMPPDAMPPDAMPPDACTPGWIDLLSNGGFESGATVWAQVGGTLIRDNSTAPWPAQAGTWAALLGGANNTDQQLTQSVTVPADATDLRIRGYRCFVTEETLAIEYDTLTVQLQGLTVEEIVWSNIDAGATCSWGAFTLTSPEAHAGETITLAFINANDGTNVTSFGLDSLVLEAFACP